ncbi:MAG: hypothetical protein KatS3mg087_0098 [Patescibacteria group bacterium]|nr:MAG: hypothetical protein KatS3mg087_0098 [Patescibacteria group bacterium]
MFLRNIPNQKLPLYLHDSTGAPKSGEAANITAYISLDGGTPQQITPVTEIGGGWYYITPTQAQTNCQLLVWWGVHATYICTGGAAFPADIFAGMAAVVADTSNTATTFKTDLSASSADRYVGMVIKFAKTAAAADEVREIVYFDPTTSKVTLNKALSVVPNAGDTFYLVGYSGR